MQPALKVDQQTSFSGSNRSFQLSVRRKYDEGITGSLPPGPHRERRSLKTVHSRHCEIARGRMKQDSAMEEVQGRLDAIGKVCYKLRTRNGAAAI
jgi:hypothetical protein